MSPRQLLTTRWKAITANWTADHWTDYATRRLNALFQTYPVCSSREMEARLSDFGIQTIPRADPHHLTTARHHLSLQIVSATPVPLYALPNIQVDSVKDTISRKEHLHNAFVNFTRDELCGDIAEKVILTCMEASQNLSLQPHELGRVSSIGNNTTTNPLDTYAFLPFLHSSGTYKVAVIGIEVKNIREWIYPESVEIWKALKACLDLNCIPVIINRSFHYTSFSFFRDIGVLGHETNKQYFAYDLRKETDFQAIKDELYFRDIVPWKVTKKGVKLDPNVVKFFTTTVPKMIERTTGRFELNKSLLLQYAPGPLHREETTIQERSKLMEEFRNAYKQYHSTDRTGW